MKTLITSGPVYGPLDDNKLVGNRTRGIWASRFARWLASRDHEVTLLVADIQEKAAWEYWGQNGVPSGANGRLVTHKGFWDYQELCHGFARTHDAAVLASAVTNWIPKVPFTGKMPTEGYTPGQAELSIPFILAPRVIDGMRKANPKLTLIGCKMTINAPREAMLDAAYKTLTGAKCHAVVANDMSGLRPKSVIYPDRATFDFDIGAEEGVNFYKHLEAVICDEHFTTVGVPPAEAYRGLVDQRAMAYQDVEDLFELIADRYRSRFVRKIAGSDRVFGAIAVRSGTGALCTPREKDAMFWKRDGEMFWKRDAVDVLYPTDDDLKQRRVRVIHHGRGYDDSLPLPKASMNATLLLRHLQAHPQAIAVLHLHERLPDVPVVPYAPPGTVRDNLREIPGLSYNIEGHGCVIALDKYGEFIQ